jgi:hypothetical protein
MYWQVVRPSRCCGSVVEKKWPMKHINPEVFLLRRKPHPQPQSPYSSKLLEGGHLREFLGWMFKSVYNLLASSLVIAGKKLQPS